tara:strand:- start:504 stop:1391 length:888 start_codon:yes stop_codon:yes gene_type:complete
MNMQNSAVRLGAAGFDGVRYMQGGGSPAFDLGETLASTGPGAISPAPDFAPLVQEYTEEMEDDKGVGSIIYDRIFGKGDITSGARESGRIGNESPDFMQTLVDDYNYPSVFDPETGENIIPTDYDIPEPVRMARPEGRRDLPTYPELEDVRGHMLGSALMSKEYGPETAKSAGNFNEFVDRFMPFPFGGQNKRDVAMDQRNNAIGRQIFLKAGIDATEAQITRLVDQEIFDQLDVIMGRSTDEQGTPAEGQPLAPRNFKSPDNSGPDVYFPRSEEGFFDTTRKVLGFSPRKYKNY